MPEFCWQLWASELPHAMVVLLPISFRGIFEVYDALAILGIPWMGLNVDSD